MPDAVNVKITDGVNSFSSLNPMPVSIGSALAVYDTKVPTLTAAYIYGITDVPGVVAANNFLSIVNPVGSGKTIIFLGTFISTYVASGASATRNSLTGKLCGVATGGTVVSNTQFAKFSSGMINSAADVRTGNPTVTAGANVFNSPPAIGTTASQFVHSVGAGGSTASGPLTLAPGEGLVIGTAAGNTSQTWNISVVWGEF